MMRLPLLIALSIAAVPALAGGTVHGDEGGCRRVAGLPEGTDLVFILHPDRIERWESSCPIIGTARSDATSVELITECSGEGETWQERHVMVPLPGEDGYLIGPVDNEDIRFEVRPCR